jgi:hypothetical protein
MASSFATLVMPFFQRKQFDKSFSAVFGEDTINLTKIGHYPQLEDVETVGNAVMDFLLRA